MRISSDVRLAVQLEPPGPVVGWANPTPAVADSGFDGLLTVLDSNGLPAAETRWTRPTDAAADEALARLNLVRVRPWQLDELGRRVAPVAPGRVELLDRVGMRKTVPEQREG